MQSKIVWKQDHRGDSMGYIGSFVGFRIESPVFARPPYKLNLFCDLHGIEMIQGKFNEHSNAVLKAEAIYDFWLDKMESHND